MGHGKIKKDKEDENSSNRMTIFAKCRVGLHMKVRKIRVLVDTEVALSSSPTPASYTGSRLKRSRYQGSCRSTKLTLGRYYGMRSSICSLLLGYQVDHALGAAAQPTQDRVAALLRPRRLEPVPSDVVLCQHDFMAAR